MESEAKEQKKKINSVKRSRIVEECIIWLSPVLGSVVFFLLQKTEARQLFVQMMLSIFGACTFSMLLRMNRNFYRHRIRHPAYFYGCYVLSFFWLGLSGASGYGCLWLLVVVFAALDAGVELAGFVNASVMLLYAGMALQNEMSYRFFITYFVLGIVMSVLFSRLRRWWETGYLFLVLALLDAVCRIFACDFSLSSFWGDGQAVFEELVSILALSLVGLFYVIVLSPGIRLERVVVRSIMTERGAVQAEKTEPVYVSEVQEMVIEKTAEEESVAEQPAAEHFKAEQPASEHFKAEQPVAEELVTEQPVAEQPVAEHIKAEELVTEQPVTEQPVAEESVTEQLVTEAAAGDDHVKEKRTKRKHKKEKRIKKKSIKKHMKTALLETEQSETDFSAGNFAGGEQSVMETTITEKAVAEKAVTEKSGKEKRAKEKKRAVEEKILQKIIQPEFPLIMRLRQYSPTLYEHSRKISELSGGAAKITGGDELLARAGGLYHEIGRITPSGNYIVAGEKIAKEAGFPSKLFPVIRQHSPMFELPKSLEAAIVMLSDSIVSTEEYLMKNGQRNQISDELLVENIFQKRISKGNLKEANLSDEEIEKLKDYFMKNLSSV